MVCLVECDACQDGMCHKCINNEPKAEKKNDGLVFGGIICKCPHRNFYQKPKLGAQEL